MSNLSNLSLVSQAQFNQDLSVGPDDLFVKVAKDLYQNMGYEEFKKFYLNATGFKNDLTLSLLPYYYSLQTGDRDEQISLLNEIFLKVIAFQNSFNWNIRNHLLQTEVTEYFQKKKRNINDLNPDKNGEFCISKIQLDWEIHSRNLDVYYDYIINQQTKAIDSRLKKKTLWESIRYYAGYSSSANEKLALEGNSRNPKLPTTVENTNFEPPPPNDDERKENFYDCHEEQTEENEQSSILETKSIPNHNYHTPISCSLHSTFNEVY